GTNLWPRLGASRSGPWPGGSQDSSGCQTLPHPNEKGESVCYEVSTASLKTFGVRHTAPCGRGSVSAHCVSEPRPQGAGCGLGGLRPMDRPAFGFLGGP